MRIFVLALFLCTFYVTAGASDGITKFGVVLLQPDVVLKERVPNVNELAEYIRAIEVAAQSEVVASTQHPKSSGFIVVAVRPGQRTNVWLDFEPPLPSLLENAVIAKVKTIQPFQARNGVVIFSLKVGLWGGAEPARVAPFPSAWKAAAQKAGRSLETGALVESIWSE